jgi:hypothetical protein
MEDRLRRDLATATDLRVQSEQELKRLRKQAKRKRFDGFTFVQRRTALILYLQGDFDKRPVVFYLLRLMGIHPHDATEADKDGLYRVVEEWFLACNDVEVDSFMQETHPGDPFLFKRARSILHDFALRDWVFAMNVAKGLAPAGRDVAVRWDQISEASLPADGDIRGPRREDLSYSRHRYFFLRWRRRMGISLGKIQTREAFTRLGISDKVTGVFLRFCGVCVLPGRGGCP